MRDTTFIYALNDPETGECRYVGKADDPHDRLFGNSGHLYECKTEKHHRANWINSLAARGLVPRLEILQEVPYAEWELWERVWIKASRKIGMDLTNATDGGDSGPIMRGKNHPLFGKKHRPASLAKMSAAHKLREKPSQETRAKLSAFQKSRNRRPETGLKISAALTGRKLSAAHCEKMSLSRKGKQPTGLPIKIGAEHPGFGKKCSEATSNFYGVYRRADTGKWRAEINTGGSRKALGTFSSEVEAAEVYDIAAKIHHGVHAVLNFPD